MPDDLDYSQLTPQRVLVLRYQLDDLLIAQRAATPRNRATQS